LCNVGLFDEIEKEGVVDVESFAMANRLDESTLRTLCNALYSWGILEKRGGNFAFGPKGTLFTCLGRGWFEIVDGYEDVFHNLEPLLRKEKRYGTEITRNTELVAKGSGAINKLIYFPLAVDIIKQKRSRRVLDLGCGEGTFLRAICGDSEATIGFGIDISKEAIALGNKRSQREGLQDRIRLIAEDISKIEILPAEFQAVDVAFTFFVLHELIAISKNHFMEFLKSFRRLLPDVPLIIFEAEKATWEEMRVKRGPAIYYTMYHELTKQKLLSRKEWIELFREAGFQSVGERYLGFARTVIFELR
jgi:SAM-dependent methyltransferase